MSLFTFALYIVAKCSKMYLNTLPIDPCSWNRNRNIWQRRANRTAAWSRSPWWFLEGRCQLEPKEEADGTFTRGFNDIDDWRKSKCFKCHTVWPDFAKLCHLSKKLINLGHISKVYLVFGKVVKPLWDNL